jgi:hypothetical protein
MEWELMKGEYAWHEVIGVTDIVMLDGPYKEAVNLVIER